MKKIAILGSTGSIGRQTLDIVREQKEIGNKCGLEPDLEVLGLSANTSVDVLFNQILEFSPKVVCVMNEVAAQTLEKMLIDANITPSMTEVVCGMDGLVTVATLTDVEMVITAVVGMIGLQPTVAAIQAGKDIGLANKETLVTAGSLIMDLVKKHHVNMIPVDSEHSAIFQSLAGNKHSEVESIILTASGGPFRGKKASDLTGVTVAQALKHPNWSMGSKITIDSATLMNKGLEVIEAKWLFDVAPNQIQVVVHPQSIVHSLVCYKDSSVIAQLGLPDMKLPIQYALYYPNRHENGFERLNLAKMGQLTFEEPDLKTFKTLQLAYDALTVGKSLPTVLNAANELLVAQFLKGQIGFLEIGQRIEEAMLAHSVFEPKSVGDILDIEKWTIDYIESRY